MRHRQSNGFTLMELMVVVFILQLVIVPLYVAFSGSKKMMVNAREMAHAVSLGSSMIAGLREVEVGKLSEIPLTAENALPAAFSLEKLGLKKAMDGFSRSLKISLIDPGSQEGGPFYEAQVDIRWKHSKQTSSPDLQLTIKGVLVKKSL